MERLLSSGSESSLAVDELVREVSSRTISRWHFEMINDIERCDAYVTAMERCIQPGMHVLDIGAGTGLLALMAARAGAGHVTTCESNPLIAEIASRVVRASGLGDRITVIAKPSTDLEIGRDLERRADLIVSEIVDCGLIGEGLLRSIRDARARLLAPGGALMPGRCRLIGALVSGNALRSLHRVGSAAGFDVSLFNIAATPGHIPVRLWTRPHRLLSSPVELVAFDLLRDPLVDGARAVTIRPNATGSADGIAAWFEMDLGGGVIIRNSPDNRTSHWEQAFLPFPEPVRVTAGRPLTVDIRWREEELATGVVATKHRVSLVTC